MNFKAAETTYSEFLDTLRAVKGEAHANFVADAVELLAGSRIIQSSCILPPDMVNSFESAHRHLLSAALDGSAQRFSIAQEDVLVAMGDAKAMLRAITAATKLSAEVV